MWVEFTNAFGDQLINGKPIKERQISVNTDAIVFVRACRISTDAERRVGLGDTCIVGLASGTEDDEQTLLVNGTHDEVMTKIKNAPGTES